MQCHTLDASVSRAQMEDLTNMADYSEEHFDHLAAQLLAGSILPSQFMTEAAKIDVPLTVVMSVLDARAVADAQKTEPTPPARTPSPTAPSAAAPTSPRFPAGWSPYPWKWGKDPIADNPTAATEWWLARTVDMSVRDDDPAVVLTSDEISELKATSRRPRLVQPSDPRDPRVEAVLAKGSAAVGASP